VAVRITGDGEVLGQGCIAANRAVASRLAAQAALGAWAAKHAGGCMKACLNKRNIGLQCIADKQAHAK
jgi:hypothetical protein